MKQTRLQMVLDGFTLAALTIVAAIALAVVVKWAALGAMVICTSNIDAVTDDAIAAEVYQCAAASGFDGNLDRFLP